MFVDDKSIEKIVLRMNKCGITVDDLEKVKGFPEKELEGIERIRKEIIET